MSQAPLVSFPKIYYTRVATRQYDTNFQDIFIKGRRFTTNAASGSYRDVYNLTFSGSLTKFTYAVTTYTNGDYFNLSGSGNWVGCETIYIKDIGESLFFEIGRYFDSGSDLIFDFYNSNNTAKSIWVNYNFVK